MSVVPPPGSGALQPEPVELRCADGRELAAHWVASGVGAGSPRRGAIVINPATGFPQTFYLKFATYAALRGYDVLVYDYRGMGRSRAGDLAADTTRMSDWGLLDMRAALELTAQRAQGAPVFTLGHSIGGQFVGLLANHALARAHVQIATSIGYWRWERAPFRYLAWWFWRVHGPLMLALRGYVPQGGGWSGLPLPRHVFEEWRRWCLRPTHFGPDLATYLSDNTFAGIRAPILSVSLEDDPIATPRTVDALRAFYPRARFENRQYSPGAVGGPIGHGGFFSSRFERSLWAPTLDWIDAQSGSAA